MRKYNPFYNPKTLFKGLGMFLLMMVSMKITKGSGFAIIIPFAFITLTRNQPALFLFYVMLSIAAVVLNSAVASKNAIFFMEQRAMMGLFGFFLATRVAGQRNSPTVKPFLIMVGYLFYMVIPSVLGWCPPVSIMKLLLFGVIFLAFYGAANMAATSSRAGLRDVRSVVLAIAIPFVFGSIALIPFPAISMMSAEELLANPNVSGLFKGITSHSQCLGPVVAVLTAVLATDLMFGVRRWDKLYMALLACCPVLVWKTFSRTAMGATAAGLLFSMFFFSKTRVVSRGWRQKVMNLAFALLILGVAVISCTGASEHVKRFIVKRGYSKGGQVNTEEVIGGRMAMSQRQFANFKKSPLFGNGFQVSEEMAYTITGPWYMTLSAPVEKGVWISAVLEEGGAFGMAIFLAFAFVALSTMIKYKAYIGASALFTCLVSNLGEFTLFSMSYAGGFVWAMIFAGVALDSARVREERTRSFAPMMPMFPGGTGFMR